MNRKPEKEADRLLDNKEVKDVQKEDVITKKMNELFCLILKDTKQTSIPKINRILNQCSIGRHKFCLTIL